MYESYVVIAGDPGRQSTFEYASKEVAEVMVEWFRHYGVDARLIIEKF